MPLSFFADLHSAELMSRVVTDVNRLARVSSTVLVMAIRQLAMIVALLSVMVVREWRLAADRGRSSFRSWAWPCAGSAAGCTGSTSARRRRSPS